MHNYILLLIQSVVCFIDIFFHNTHPSCHVKTNYDQIDQEDIHQVTDHRQVPHNDQVL